MKSLVLLLCMSFTVLACSQGTNQLEMNDAFSKNKKQLIKKRNFPGIYGSIRNRRVTKVVYTPDSKNNTQTHGTVIIDISVDKKGKVVKASFHAKGSTSNHPKLIELSLEAAKEFKFKVNPRAPKLQHGMLLFNFKPK